MEMTVIPPCNLPAEALVVYAEGELRGDPRKVVEEHVRVCPTCQQRLGTLRWVDQKLQGSSLIEDVQNRLSINAQLKDALHRPAPRKGYRTLLAWTYLALLFVVLLFFILRL